MNIVNTVAVFSLIVFSAVCWGNQDDVIFEDGFENSGTLDASKWERQDNNDDGKVYVTINSSIKKSGSYGAAINNGEGGLRDYDGREYVALASRSIDLSSVPSAKITFSFSNWTTVSDQPEVQEDLVVDFYDGSAWKEYTRFFSSEVSDVWRTISFDIPPQYLINGFKFRFKIIGLNGDTTPRFEYNNKNRDYWHIDDVSIVENIPIEGKCNSTSNAAKGYVDIFCDEFERNTVSDSQTPTWSPNDTAIVVGRPYISNTTKNNGSKSMNLYRVADVVDLEISLSSLDLSDYEDVKVYYWWQRGGVTTSVSGDGFPTSQFDLIFKYRANGLWQTVQNVVGNVRKGEIGETFFNLPANTLNNNVQFKFVETRGPSVYDKEYHVDTFLIVGRKPYHHLEFNYNDHALTCVPPEITIKVCDNADCSRLYQSSLTVNLTNLGWAGGTQHVIRNGQKTLTLPIRTAGTYTLAATSTTPNRRDANNADTCRKNGAATAGSHCSLTFHDSGFAFDVPNVIANKPSNEFKVKAVRKDAVTQQCIPAFANKNRQIDTKFNYTTPNTGTKSVFVQPQSGTNTQLNAANTSQPLTLSFDANGEARVRATYQDAGRVTLHMSYTGTTANGDSGLSMTGVDSFTSRPVGFCITPTQANASCSAPYHNCSVFKKAGQAFNVDVIAKAWQSDSDTDYCQGNLLTPNFSSNVSLSSSLVAPSGGVNATVAPTSFTHVASVLAKTSLTNVTLSEVGVFKLTTAAINYLDQTIPPSSSANIGRFVPDHFALQAIRQGVLTGQCNAAYTYLGDEMLWTQTPQFTVQANNVANVKTRNYRGQFAKLLGVNTSRLTDQEIDWTLSEAQKQADNSAFALTSSLETANVTNPATGQGAFNIEFNGRLAYTKTLESKVAPFSPNIDIDINQMTDSDNVALKTNGNLVLKPTLVGALQARYGRLRLQDTYGPETVPLWMPMRAEYYNGGRFVLNRDDHCTTYDTRTASAKVVLTQSGGSMTYDGIAGALNNGSTAVSQGIQLFSGVSSCSNLNVCRANVEYKAPTWLKDGFGTGNLINPSAYVQFGTFRGHDRVIFWREVTD